MAAVTSYENALLSYQKFDSFPATHRWHKDHEVYPADLPRSSANCMLMPMTPRFCLFQGTGKGPFQLSISSRRHTGHTAQQEGNWFLQHTVEVYFLILGRTY